MTSDMVAASAGRSTISRHRSELNAIVREVGARRDDGVDDACVRGDSWGVRAKLRHQSKDTSRL